MDTFRLECFIALAEELHFHRAADRCHISQPALSQQIRALEQELRVQVAVRTKRSVSLTLAGEAFLHEARRTVRQLGEAIDLARRTDAGETGQLRIGATGPALYVVFPEIVREFMAKHPGIGILPEEMTTAQAERALRRGDVELAIVHPPLDDPDLACEVVAQPPFAVALPSEHPLSAHSEVSLADLAEEHFVMFPREIGPQLYDAIIGMCRAVGYSPKIAHYAHPAQSIIALVSAGLGIGFIASSVQRLQRPGVVYRPLVGPRPMLTLGIAHRAGHRSPAVAQFKDAARTACRALAANGTLDFGARRSMSHSKGSPAPRRSQHDPLE